MKKVLCILTACVASILACIVGLIDLKKVVKMQEFLNACYKVCHGALSSIPYTHSLVVVVVAICTWLLSEFHGPPNLKGGYAPGSHSPRNAILIRLVIAFLDKTTEGNSKDKDEFPNPDRIISMNGKQFKTTDKATQTKDE